jgi:hypothetical protein
MPKWEKFANHEKITKRRSEIDIALTSAARIVLITVHIGPQPADAGVLNRVTSIAETIDGGSGIAKAMHWHQKNLLDALSGELDPPTVDADFYLSNWGQTKDPYHSVFGRIQGRAIAELWSKHPHLSHVNLRDYSHRSEVNDAIAETVLNEPMHFWYFNNGLTIICDSITPGVYGSMNHDVALFHFEGIRIVNGAQTTGVVSDQLSGLTEADQDRLWIQVRVIAVKNCPDGFAKRVTKFTNLQNAISVQDWVALDPVQSRIATDFAIAKRRYDFRWGGNAEPFGEQGCTLKEATLAIACADPDPWYAVQAKREIGVLWDTESVRYRNLFNENLTARRIWNSVKILRTVDKVIEEHNTDTADRSKHVASHLQRIVLHIVFQDPAMTGWDVIEKVDTILSTAEDVARRVFSSVRAQVNSNNGGEYLASLSKNFERCRSLVAAVQSSRTAPVFVEKLFQFRD